MEVQINEDQEDPRAMVIVNDENNQEMQEEREQEE